jgi:hypothetical protein
MAVGSVLADAGKSALGIVESAKIILYDQRKVVATSEEKTSATSMLAKVTSLVAAPDNTEYAVQFNPNSLSIDGEIVSKPVTSATDSPGTVSTVTEDGKAVQIVQAPTIELTVKLVFDRVNLSDAFMQEKFTSPFSASAAKNVVSTGMAALKGETWTVAPIVEGFIGAIRNDKTRLLRFQWRKFQFTGNLRSVRAEYVMFSPSGRPVRAFVTLRLKNDMEQDKKYWDDCLSNAFPGAETLSSYSGLKNKVGNLFNLSW